MIKVVKENISTLESICREYHVASLLLFGSAAKGNFNYSVSDIDLAVEFSAAVDPLDFAANYFSLLEKLETLYSKKVDLLSLRAVKNAVMIKEIESSKIQLYAA